jgi:predicted SAM-dependent methyltransferase
MRSLMTRATSDKVVKDKGLVLDIGCGEDKKGDIGIDIRKTNVVDVIADARFLPFRDESFNHVYSSHLIEHFSHREVKDVLVEWVRVLKKGGVLEIRCPDLRARALLFFLNPSWQNVRNIYGAQDYAGNYHKCGFSYGLLKDLLESCGIHKVKRVIKGYKGIPFLPDCLHVKGVKDIRQ